MSEQERKAVNKTIIVSRVCSVSVSNGAVRSGPPLFAFAIDA